MIYKTPCTYLVLLFRNKGVFVCSAQDQSVTSSDHCLESEYSICTNGNSVFICKTRRIKEMYNI